MAISNLSWPQSIFFLNWFGQSNQSISQTYCCTQDISSTWAEVKICYAKVCSYTGALAVRAAIETDPKKRVVITGMGVVSCFGNDVDTFYDAWVLYANTLNAYRLLCFMMSQTHATHAQQTILLTHLDLNLWHQLTGLHFLDQVFSHCKVHLVCNITFNLLMVETTHCTGTSFSWHCRDHITCLTLKTTVKAENYFLHKTVFFQLHFSVSYGCLQRDESLISSPASL